MNKIFNNIVNALDFTKAFIKKKPVRKPSILRDLLNDTDAFELNAIVENGEIKITIKKRIVKG